VGVEHLGSHERRTLTEAGPLDGISGQSRTGEPISVSDRDVGLRVPTRTRTAAPGGIATPCGITNRPGTLNSAVIVTGDGHEGVSSPLRRARPGIPGRSLTLNHHASQYPRLWPTATPDSAARGGISRWWRALKSVDVWRVVASVFDRRVSRLNCVNVVWDPPVWGVFGGV
jgi:hypothetical protein